MAGNKLALPGGAIQRSAHPQRLKTRFVLDFIHFLREIDVHVFSLRSRRQNVAWGGALLRGTPGILRSRISNPRSGWQLLVIRHPASAIFGQSLSPAPRANAANHCRTWGSAQERSTPGFMLPPAS